jgi:hypothetical protein
MLLHWFAAGSAIGRPDEPASRYDGVARGNVWFPGRVRQPNLAPNCA